MSLSDLTARRLLDAAPDVLLVVDSDGRLVFVNRSAERVFGYEPEELVGKDLQVLLPESLGPAHAERTRAFFAQPAHLSAGRQGVEGRRKDGSRFPAEVSVSRLEEPDGRSLAVACVRDASEGRAMEQSRRQQEALHAAIFAKAPIGIAVVSLDGSIVASNPALREMLGYQAEELEGMHFADITHPDDIDSDLERYRQLIDGEVDSYSMEKRYVCKEGTVIRANLRVSLIGEPEHARRYAIGMVEDVTQERSLQEQLFLSQRLEAVGQLAGGIAHDFNNYLTAISGYSQLAMLELPEDHAARADLLEVMRAADSSAHLTRQILAFSRRQVLERRPLDLNDLLREVHKMLARLLGEDIEIEMDLDEGLWPVSADPAQLEQVLINLAVNARDAMPTGGDLVLRTSNAEIDRLVASQRPGMSPGAYVLLSVADTGTGMSPEIQNRVFEPFFTTKQSGRGTGLGLSTVYGIVKQHGGNIWVYSEPDAGTTFRIYLPRLAGGKAAAGLTVTELTEPPSGSGHVLVVEDDEHVRTLVTRSLESCGYEVTSAGSAAEALDLVSQGSRHIDLLLTDVVMPRTSGLELADRLREIRPRIKTLFMSGHSAEALARYRPERETRRWLHKPFTLGKLARAVAEALGDREG